MINFSLERGNFFASPINFHSHVSPAKEWETWMRDIFANPNFVRRLKSAGIYDAILMSKIHIRRDTRGLAFFVSRWCIETHTFFLAWGELTITVEDVVSLLNLPTFRSVCPSYISLNPTEERCMSTLERGIHDSTKEEEIGKSSKWPSLSGWIRYWRVINKVRSSEASFANIITLWLSRHIFEDGAPFDGFKKELLPLAIILAAGEFVPLAVIFWRGPTTS
ncbi:Aminotransferase-like [Macleaya cordata]|uniref:Aminotransferase-like n=1 Tax=Macleaya cordata TaxID=56857 RepID=A0A200QI38_MACCD|nr:Aminotransferase-like [Macleaya cordata]